mmetsp:Transcript_37144/g.93241  ORF Transcript_37144/g.93241 Transcript_37144/m.93241 type:complete len:237 (-) Transcript_37144:87-797(-)
MLVMPRQRQIVTLHRRTLNGDARSLNKLSNIRLLIPCEDRQDHRRESSFFLARNCGPKASKSGTELPKRGHCCKWIFSSAVQRGRRTSIPLSETFTFTSNSVVRFEQQDARRKNDLSVKRVQNDRSHTTGEHHLDILEMSESLIFKAALFRSHLWKLSVFQRLASLLMTRQRSHTNDARTRVRRSRNLKTASKISGGRISLMQHAVHSMFFTTASQLHSVSYAWCVCVRVCVQGCP